MKGTIRIINHTYLKPEPKPSSELQGKLVLVQPQEIRAQLIKSGVNAHSLFSFEGRQVYIYEGDFEFIPDPVQEQIGSYLRLTRTDKKDSFGCFILRLQYFKNGVAVEEMKMRSGQPSKQYFRKGVDSISGSGEPLPEGRWRIENLFWAAGKDNWNASHGDGIGPVSVPLTYDGPGTTGRSAIVIHNDHNVKTGKPGSVGCPVTWTLEDMRKVVGWLRDSDPKYLYADWNLGSCPPVGSPKSEPHSSTLPVCGVELIKKFEGCLKDVGGGWLEAYPDPKTGGIPWTIGWGSTRKLDGTAFKPGERITKAEADSLLLHQLEHNYYSKLQATIPYWDEMSENQRGALLSFCYNLGAAFFGSPNFNTITNLLKTKQWAAVPNALMLYRNPGTRVELGLKRRRLAEGLVWQGMSVDEAFSKAVATVVL
jgi:GH24 family phage-related lysozyme (muramidase)